MEYLANYGLFLAKTLTFVLGFVLCLIAVVAVALRDQGEGKKGGKIIIKSLNEHYDEIKNTLKSVVDSKPVFNAFLKKTKKAAKEKNKLPGHSSRKRVYVIDFEGDMRAEAVESLREEITAVLCIATPNDEVVVKIDSGGGVVHGYGLCAIQLNRFREKKIPLTVIIDKIAASGGYLMASVANKIITAPFAIVGSIGVLAQLPNFNRFLKKHAIDFEMLSAGQYKRTLTLFGENTEKGRHKLIEELEETHYLFKEFISTYRPQLDLEKVATGEYWMGSTALELNLVDELGNSDDYLFNAANERDIYSIRYQEKKSLTEKFSHCLQAMISKALHVFMQENKNARFYQ